LSDQVEEESRGLEDAKRARIAEKIAEREARRRRASS
jgi:hypothetical protein